MLAAVALLLLLAGTAVTAQPTLYRWVDDDGVVHYGDRVPPEYAHQSRHRLNQQGVEVGFEEGALSDEQRSEQARTAAEAEEQRRARAEVARRDRMLLDTYLSVQDIENLRDQRLELLESQIQVTEIYLDNLRQRLARLHKEASRFHPYSDNEDARPIPDNLAQEISQTLRSISAYEATLARTREEQEALRTSFARDITRFRELKGG